MSEASAARSAPAGRLWHQSRTRLTIGPVLSASSRAIIRKMRGRTTSTAASDIVQGAIQYRRIEEEALREHRYQVGGGSSTQKSLPEP